MIVIGVDPGKITGIAFWCSPDAAARPWLQGGPWLLTEVPAYKAVKTIRMVMRSCVPTRIACERFVQGSGRRAMTHQPEAPELTGELRELARAYDCHFSLQLPGPAKKMAPNSVLKKIGAYLPTPDGHANDGARQVIRALALDHKPYFVELLGI